MSAPTGLPVGPFEREPVELGRAVGALAPDAPDPDEIVRRVASWLVERLDARGVALGAADVEVAHVLADEGWSVAQVVAGWVARAGTQR